MELKLKSTCIKNHSNLLVSALLLIELDSDQIFVYMIIITLSIVLQPVLFLLNLTLYHHHQTIHQWDSILITVWSFVPNPGVSHFSYPIFDPRNLKWLSHCPGPGPGHHLGYLSQNEEWSFVDCCCHNC